MSRTALQLWRSCPKIASFSSACSFRSFCGTTTTSVCITAALLPSSYHSRTHSYPCTSSCAKWPLPMSALSPSLGCMQLSLLSALAGRCSLGRSSTFPPLTFVPYLTLHPAPLPHICSLAPVTAVSAVRCCCLIDLLDEWHSALLTASFFSIFWCFVFGGDGDFPLALCLSSIAIYPICSYRLPKACTISLLRHNTRDDQGHFRSLAAGTSAPSPGHHFAANHHRARHLALQRRRFA